MSYSKEQLSSIYSLAKMYYEMGYYSPAERILNGLAAIDQGRTPARLGLGLVSLEKGAFQEATSHFRVVLEQESFNIEAKLGLVAAYIALDEPQRAKSLTEQIEKNLTSVEKISSDQLKLLKAFKERVSVG